MMYDIVNVQITHPSFSWGNGLYAVIERTETDLKLCQLKDDGSLHLFEDGRFMITCTSINNQEVYATNLKFEYDKINCPRCGKSENVHESKNFNKLNKMTEYSCNECVCFFVVKK